MQSTKRKYLALVMCFFECLFFGGTIYGWASMAFVLKKDKIFAFLCPTMSSNASFSPVVNVSSGAVNLNMSDARGVGLHTCQAQDKQLSLVFTAGAVAFTGCAFIFGRLFDKAGLRITRVVGSICGVSGYLLLAFARAGARSWLVYPGVCLMSMSCIVVIMTNCHIARMAGSRASTLIGIYIGAINMAIFVFLVLKLLHDRGVSRVYSLCGLTCLWLPFLANTFLLLPKNKIVPPSPAAPAHEGDTQKETKSGTLRVTYVALETKEPSQSKPDSGDVRPAAKGRNLGHSDDKWWSYLLSPMYPVYVYWWATMHVRFLMFLATFNPWVTQTVKGDLEKVSHFTNILGYTQLWTIVISPIAGLITDLQRKKITEMNLHGLDKSIVCVPSLTVASIGAIALSATVFIETETSLYASIIISEFYRSFFYANGVTFLEMTFPARHYGTLFGLCRTIAGTASFIQFPYTTWGITSDHGYIPVNILLLVTVVLSLGLPIYVTCRSFCHRRRNTLELK